MRLLDHSPAWMFALALLALPARGQEQKQPAEKPAAAAPTEELLTLQFEGGTLAEFIQELKAAGKGINILVPAKASQVQLPPITIRDVNVHTALEAVGEVVDRSTSRIDTKMFRLGLGLPVYSVRVEIHERPEARPAITKGSPSSVEVLSLRRIIERPPGVPNLNSAFGRGLELKPDTVLTAIDVGLGLASGSDAGKPVIKYHADSALLFIKGTPEQVGLVTQIVRRLEADAMEAAGPRPRVAPAEEPAKEKAR